MDTLKRERDDIIIIDGDEYKPKRQMTSKSPDDEFMEYKFIIFFNLVFTADDVDCAFWVHNQAQAEFIDRLIISFKNDRKKSDKKFAHHVYDLLRDIQEKKEGWMILRDCLYFSYKNSFLCPYFRVYGMNYDLFKEINGKDHIIGKIINNEELRKPILPFIACDPKQKERLMNPTAETFYSARHYTLHDKPVFFNDE